MSQKARVPQVPTSCRSRTGSGVPLLFIRAAPSFVAILWLGLAHLVEHPTLSISKDCGGLSGTATLTLSVKRNNETLGNSFDQSVQCGKSVPVTTTPNEVPIA